MSQQDDCQTCLLDGLEEIGINATPEMSLDFGAINSDDDCITLAHSIEACLDGKGYFVAPLSSGFIANRAAAAVVAISSLVNALVLSSWPK